MLIHRSYQARSTFSFIFKNSLGDILSSFSVGWATRTAEVAKTFHIQHPTTFIPCPSSSLFLLHLSSFRGKAAVRLTSWVGSPPTRPLLRESVKKSNSGYRRRCRSSPCWTTEWSEWRALGCLTKCWGWAEVAEHTQPWASHFDHILYPSLVFSFERRTLA